MNQPTESDLRGRLSRGYRRDLNFGYVFDRAPTTADDLTVIRGIHTREAVILNRLGIYYVAQIALWDHRQVVAFAGELGMSASTLIEEHWIEQAENYYLPVQPTNEAPARHLPASLISTLTLVVCAMMISCIVLYWLGSRSDQRLQGVLSADITSLRVPA